MMCRLTRPISMVLCLLLAVTMFLPNLSVAYADEVPEVSEPSEPVDDFVPAVDYSNPPAAYADQVPEASESSEPVDDFVPAVDYAFRDDKIDASTRIDEIMSLLTLEEKIAMATSGTAPAVARIGLNAGRGGSLEAVHGAMRSGQATVFPASLGLSQSWDKDLLFQVGDIIAKEALASGQVGALAPILDILRDPRYGRAYETLGEDAYLIGSLGSEMARGMNQRTEDGYQQFLPIVKHFMAYGNEINRLWTNSSIPQRALNEYYIKSFKYPVSDGTVKSLMSSYPLVNGKPMSVSPLMDQLLNEWTPNYKDTGHYEYRTINDYGSGSSMWMHSQRYFPDNPDARALGSAQGLKNGQMSWSFRNQIESDSTTGLHALSQIYDALARGMITEEDIDKLARRNLTLSLRLGDYDHLGTQNPYTALMTPTRAEVIPAGREAALRASQEQIVLLKNDDAMLPLKNKSNAVLLGSMGEDIMKDNYTGASYYNITIKNALENKLGEDHVYYDRAVDTFAIKASNGKYLTAANNVFREPGQSTAADTPIRATGTAATDNDVQMSERNLLFEFYDFGDVYQELRTPINDLFVVTPQLVEAQANRGGLVNNTYGAGQGSAGVNETEWCNFMKFYIVPTNDGKYGIYTPINGNGAINNFGESAMAHEDDEDVNNGTYFRLIESGNRANEIVANPDKEFVGPYRNENHVDAADITNSPFDVNGDDAVVDNLPADCKFDFQTVRSSTDAIAETLTAAPGDAPVILVVGYEAHLNAREPVDVQYTGLSKQHQRNIDFITNELGRDVILIVKTNNPMTIDATVQDNPKVKSIMMIGHSGQEEGSALVSALFADGYSVPATGWAPARNELYSPYTVYSEYPGWLDENGKIPAYAPAGRLTATWYAEVSDMLGASNDHAPASYRWPAYDEETNDNLSNLHGTIPTGLLTYDIIKGERTYQYFKGTPLYGFGYGLTYTSFNYSGLNVSGIANGSFTVSGKITNTGSITSDEVVQIYSTFDGSPSRILQPQKRLIAYDRLLDIAPGETRSFSFKVDLEDKLGVWDVERGDYIVETGNYQIKAAKSSSDPGTVVNLNVTPSNGGTKASERNLNRMVLAEAFDDYSNLSGDASDIELVSSSIDFHSNTAVQFRENGAWISFKDVEFPAGTDALTLRVGSDRPGAIKVYQVPVGTSSDALASMQPVATLSLDDTRSVPGLSTGLGVGPFSVTNQTLLKNTPNPGSPVGQDGIDPMTGYPYKDAYIKPEYKTVSMTASIEPGKWDVYVVTEERGSRLEWLKFGTPDTTQSLEISNINMLDSIREKDGTLPLRADLTPVTSVSSVSWSVTGLDGSATALATISEDGVLTAAGTANGTVLVTATSGGESANREILITNQLDSNRVTISGTPKTVDYLILRNGTSFGANDNIQRFQGTNQQTAIFAELFSENADQYYLSGKRYLTVPASELNWTVTGTDGSPTDLATVSPTGLVTATGVGDGEVMVTASLLNNPDITVSRVITLCNQGVKNAFRMIQAENWDVASANANAATTFARGGNEFGMQIPMSANNTWTFKNVDFGSTQPDEFAVRLAPNTSSTSSVMIEVWADAATEGGGGKLLATVNAHTAGSNVTYDTFVAAVGAEINGVHDIILKPSQAARVNWFTFGGTPKFVMALNGSDHVLPGEAFTLGVSLESVTSAVYAQDVALSYDPELFEFIDASSAAPGTQIIRTDTSNPGSVRLISVNIGGVMGASNPLLDVLFKVKDGVTNGSGIFAVTKADLGMMPDGTVKEAVRTSKTIHIGLAVDKSELEAVIAEAQDLYDSAETGSDPGQYPPSAKAAFGAAIEAAGIVYADANATQAEIDAAVEALNEAIDDFKASEIESPDPDVDKSALAAAITSAQALYDNTDVGTENGQCWESDKAVFLAAIEAASIVYADANATQAGVDAAVEALNEAKAAFEASIITAATGDLNGDQSINVGDLAIVAYYYGANPADENWSVSKLADLNRDGIVDIQDLAFIAMRILQ